MKFSITYRAQSVEEFRSLVREFGTGETAKAKVASVVLPPKVEGKFVMSESKFQSMVRNYGKAEADMRKEWFEAYGKNFRIFTNLDGNAFDQLTRWKAGEVFEEEKPSKGEDASFDDGEDF